MSDTATTTRKKIYTPLVLMAPAMPVKAQIQAEKYAKNLQVLLADDRYLSVGSELWDGIPDAFQEKARAEIEQIPPVEPSYRPKSQNSKYRALTVVPNVSGKSALITAGTVPILLVLVDPACLVVEETITAPVPEPVIPEGDDDEDEEDDEDDDDEEDEVE